MKIKTQWIKIRRKTPIRIEKPQGSGRFKTSNYVKVRKGNSVILQYRLESFWKHFYSSKTKTNKIATYNIAKDKIDYDKMKYAYVYLTGKSRLIVKKLWIKSYRLEKTETYELKNRTVTHYWYSFTFYKQKDLKLQTTHSIYTDISYCDDEEVENSSRHLSDKKFTQIFLKVYSQGIGIGRSGEKISKRRKLGTTTYNRRGLNSIKYNYLNKLKLTKHITKIQLSRMFKISNSGRIVGKNYFSQ